MAWTQPRRLATVRLTVDLVRAVGFGSTQFCILMSVQSIFGLILHILGWFKIFGVDLMLFLTSSRFLGPI